MWKIINVFKRNLKPIFVFLKKHQLKLKGCKFEKNVQFDNLSKFEGMNFISTGTFLRDVTVGLYSYMGYGCYLTGAKIGRYTSIGPGMKTAIGSHPTKKFVSTHPLFFSATPPGGNSVFVNEKFEEIKFAYVDDKGKKFPIIIGNDVWIGANVTIVDGVRIGDGAIIGANTLVLHNVEPYSVVVGVPARIVRKRFTDEQIACLLRIKWWEKGETWVRENARHFDDIEQFCELFKSEKREYV